MRAEGRAAPETGATDRIDETAETPPRQATASADHAPEPRALRHQKLTDFGARPLDPLPTR